ncbi:BON domain-containing protein [Terriglobus sp. RCC_193]|uniref:BON domain-containing protein n=1 Tax=Terriglobus sp. RCC_193 TaxID=3239218 RepID=UPI003523D1BB
MSMSMRFTKTIALAAVLLAGVSGCKQAAPVDDATLTTQVQQKIAAESGLANEPVQVSTVNGAVTLNGAVSNAAARTLAANDAASVTGVRQVLNNITVAPPINAADLAQPVPPPAASAPKAPVVTKKAPTPAPVRNTPTPAPIERAAAPAPVQQPAPPPPPPQPVVRTITIPSGTTIPVRVTQTLDSASTQQGERFSGAVATDIVQDGMLVIPRGSVVSGTVTEAHEAAHFKGSSLLTVEITGVTVRGQNIPLAVTPYSVEGKGRGKNTAVKTGVGAAAGAILGGIFGGGKGAAIGAAAGGGTGAGINAVTRGEQVQIPSESVVRFSLTNAVAVRTSTHAGGGDGSGLQNR